MTALPPFPPTVDTLTRRILSTVFLLRSAIAKALDTEINPDLSQVSPFSKEILFESVKFSPVLNRNSFLAIEVNIFYDRFAYMQSGGNLVDSCRPFTNLTFPFTPNLSPSTDLTESVPPIPSSIRTLEQLFVHDCAILEASTYPQVSYITRSLFDSKQPPIAFFKLLLPYDRQRYSVLQEYISSVSRVFDHYIINEGQLTSSTSSSQFWGNPVSDIAAIQALSDLPEGVTRWVISNQSFYTVTSLPVGVSPDGDLWVRSSQQPFIYWKKCAVGPSQPTELSTELSTELWSDAGISLYLDTVNGIDTNDGLSQLTPFKTWEKAKDTLKVKLINNQQNTKIFVKGILQAPLSFKGIYGLSTDPQRPAYLELYAWKDDNGRFTPYKIQGVTSAVANKQGFVDLDPNLKIHLSNVVIDIPDRLIFSGSNIYFNNITWQFYDTTAPYYLNNSNDAVIFADGKYEFQGTFSLKGYRYAKITFADNTINKINGNWEFDSDSNNYTAFNFVGNSLTQFSPANASYPSVVRSLRLDKPAKVYAVVDDPQWNYSGGEIPFNAQEYMTVKRKGFVSISITVSTDNDRNVINQSQTAFLIPDRNEVMKITALTVIAPTNTYGHESFFQCIGNHHHVFGNDSYFKVVFDEAYLVASGEGNKFGRNFNNGIPELRIFTATGGTWLARIDYEILS